MEAVRKLTSIARDVVDTGSLGDATNALATRLSQVVPQNEVDTILDFTSNGTDMYQVMASLAVSGTLVHMGGNTSHYQFHSSLP
jgi:D-arabinose 1-dehydrogenase-like Zn-dependent alcohol dehydrogenase